MASARQPVRIMPIVPPRPEEGGEGERDESGRQVDVLAGRCWGMGEGSVVVSVRASSWQQQAGGGGRGGAVVP